MTCDKYSEWISLYIDEELEIKDLVEFERHLENCKSCQEEVHILRHIVNDIKTLEMIELPEGFHQDLMTKIEKEKQNNKIISLPLKQKKWYKNLKIASAVAAVFIFSTVLLDPLKTNAPKELKSEIQEDSVQPRMMAELPVDFSMESSEDVSQDQNQVKEPIESIENMPESQPTDQEETAPSADSKDEPTLAAQIPEEEPTQTPPDAKADSQPQTRIKPAVPRQNEQEVQGVVFSNEPRIIEQNIETWLIQTSKGKSHKETIINAAEELGLDLILVEELGSKEEGILNITMEITLKENKKLELESKIKEVEKTVTISDENQENPDSVKLIIIINQISQ